MRDIEIFRQPELSEGSFWRALVGQLTAGKS
jgi:hypothetical protein